MLKRCLAICALVTAVAPADAMAQSDVLLRLRSGSPLSDRARADSAGGFVAMGELGIGTIPASGCGYRMMWYPFRAAFRAGGTDDGGACDYWNDANVGFYSWAGGNLTRATAFASFAFGDQVTVSGVDAAAFGGSNTVSGTVGFATGASNHCTGFGCVTMGFTNTASGQGSIAIGYRVTADANYAVSLGHRASANGRSGSFNIADASTTDSLEASANNQFNARYAGGYRLFTNSTTTVGVSLDASDNTWNSVSDRNLKDNISPVDPEGVLIRLRSVPISTWQYRDQADLSATHIGPMAQDWHRAFGFREDSVHINMGDIDGVALAAILALERRTVELQAALQDAEAEGRSLQAQVAALHERLARLEAMLAREP